MTDLGLVSGKVRIQEYNPEWKSEYLKEEMLLKKQLQDYKTDIQHVGSTSILGCSAKPIIDIAIGVESVEYGEQLIPIICNMGYIYDGDGGIPGRHFFKKKSGELSTHYIHLESTSGVLWNNHILFRDYLNKHTQLIEEYSKLKIYLANDFSENRNDYAAGKNPFIEKVIVNAKKENGIAKLF